MARRIIGVHFFLICLMSCYCGQSESNSEMKESVKTRVILDTDANNELDDQHAIAYLLFNGNIFDVEGITVNKTRNGGGIQQHFEEAERVVKLCNLASHINIYKGADGNFDEIKEHINEPDFDGIDAVNFIVARAKASDDRKLVLLPVGKLTNVALALAKDPAIASKIRIVWLGSNYPDPGEYNHTNDCSAMNYLLENHIDFEIVVVRKGKPSGMHAVQATLSDIRTIMPGKGPQTPQPVIGRHGGSFSTFGDYSVSLFENINLYGDPPARALYDMAAVAIVKNPTWATAARIPGPARVDGDNGRWVENMESSYQITIWENFNKDAIIGDFFYSMEHYTLAD